MELPGGGLAFASELQALQCVPGFDPEISVDAMAEVLMFQYIGAPPHDLPIRQETTPGHWLTARAGETLDDRAISSFSPTVPGSRSNSRGA